MYPSKFFLDGTVSSSVDKSNGFTDLSYEWIFPEEAQAKIIDTDMRNGKITIAFNAVGRCV